MNILNRYNLDESIFSYITSRINDGYYPYFLTISPKSKEKLGNTFPYSAIESLFENYTQYQYHLMRELTNNPVRNKAIAPISIAFADVEGSKKHKPNFLIPPHLHAIVLIHPKTIERFRQAEASGFRDMLKSNKLGWIGGHELKPIGSTCNDVSEVVSYCSKALPEIAKTLNVGLSDCMNWQPKANSELSRQPANCSMRASAYIPNSSPAAYPLVR